jgi:ABC-2 type transport system ATP-binding protein
MSDGPVIVTRGLHKTYRTGFWMRPHVGLHPLDLRVAGGSVFGFVGPNGAGKTTTIKILVGIHEASGGEATVLGLDHRDPEARRKVGFMPERPYFYPHLTGAELLDFYGRLFEVPEPTRSQRARALLERVDMARAADQPLRSYSKGMLQRVGICQALINDPQLVILDEPMSGLDPLGRALVRDLILEEKARGRSVFFSSHILHDVETLSDRVAILVGGRLRSEGTVDDLLGAGSKGVELELRLPAGAAPAAWAARLGAELRRAEGDRALLIVPPDRSAAAVALSQAQGATLLRLTPLRASLEELLMSEIEAAGRGSATAQPEGAR